MTGLDNVSRYFSLIRSKDAGPFMLTLDLFFADEHSRRAFPHPCAGSAPR